ncbi:unnamed protein product [Diamesa serratosioi]
MVYNISRHFNSSNIRNTNTVDNIQHKNEITFEEALIKAKFGKFNYFLILISGVIMATMFFETMGINYVLPVAECDLKMTSKTQYGLVSGVWFAGIIISSHLWGILADSYGRKRIICVALLLTFSTSILSSFATSFWQLIVFRFFNGLCISGSSSTIFAYLGEFLDQKNRSQSIMAASVVFAGSCLLLPTLAWLVINQHWQFYVPFLQVIYKPWRLFLLACGIPSFICGLILILLPESPKYTFSQGDEAATIKIFRQIYYANTGKTDYNVAKIKKDEEFLRTKDGKNLIKNMISQSRLLGSQYLKSIVIMSLLQFGIFFVCNGMLLFFPDILNQMAQYMQNPDSTNNSIKLCEIVENAISTRKLQLNETFISTNDVYVDNKTGICVETLDISAYYYAIILEAFYTGGFLIISILVNVVGKLAIVSTILFSTGICGLAIVFIKMPTLSIYLYVILLASGLTNNLLNTATYDLFPTNLRSLALSISLMFGRLGSLIGGNVAGLLLENYCNSSFAISGVSLLLCGVLSFFIPNIMRKR